MGPHHRVSTPHIEAIRSPSSPLPHSQPICGGVVSLCSLPSQFTSALPLLPPSSVLLLMFFRFLSLFASFQLAATLGTTSSGLAVSVGNFFVYVFLLGLGVSLLSALSLLASWLSLRCMREEVRAHSPARFLCIAFLPSRLPALSFPFLFIYTGSRGLALFVDHFVPGCPILSISAILFTFVFPLLVFSNPCLRSLVWLCVWRKLGVRWLSAHCHGESPTIANWCGPCVSSLPHSLPFLRFFPFFISCPSPLRRSFAQSCTCASLPVNCSRSTPFFLAFLPQARSMHIHATRCR